MKALHLLAKGAGDAAFLVAVGLYTLLTLLVLGRKAWTAKHGGGNEDPLEG